MDGFELNKVFGAATGALLAFVAISILTEGLFHSGHGGHHGEEKYAFAMAIEEDEGGAEEVAEAPAEEPIEVLLAAADPASGEKVFKKCQSCHNVDAGSAHKVGPMLHGIVGREIGGTDFGKYSGALPEGVWDFAALDAFLKNPSDYAAGTSMAFRGLKKGEDRADVIAWLNQQSASPLPLPEATQ
ncbi:MAG: cytochrome c family protein [Pseudomonadota bacterium]